MEIKKNITIHLSESNVKEIIANYLKEKGYPVTITNVSIKIDSEWKGYGYDEHKEYFFKGIDVNYEEK